MYSRYGDDPQKSIRVPEHYGGSAFSQRPKESSAFVHKEIAKPSRQGDFLEKASPAADRLLRSDLPEEKIPDVPKLPDVPEVSATAPENEAEPATSAEKTLTHVPAGGTVNFAALRRLLDGKGDGGEQGDQDRLLLLGLILLLSRGQEESDILLWLSLLLLCG